MDNIRFNNNLELIKSFMDRLWAILPVGWRPELRTDRKRDSIELCVRNFNDHIYTKRYFSNVSNRLPQEILLDVAIWMERYIVETHAGEKKLQNSRFQITKVIFNDPATIVFWLDGTKTVVKCDDKERYDPEKGLAMAISKKAFGNQGNYYNEFKKWLPDKMHLAPNVIVGALRRRYPYGIMAHDITSEDLTSRNQNAIKELEKSLAESIRNGELKTSDLYNPHIIKDLLFGRYPYGKKGDDQND